MNAPKCPICHQSDIGILDGQCAVCRSCSKSKRCVFQFCLECQREWPRDASTTESCMLPNCALRAALLRDTIISDPESSEFCFRCLRPECYDNEDDEYYDDYDQDDPEPELCVIVDNTEILQHLGL
ncbi:uncharacterized protein si:ch211-284e13.9 isoform X3 [Chanodichthys erythropterus]|uniref:uncharacterized protein si:ch211-284e13.9 isoform X3 n=1 Tax=Chanodichthys erythropterus TaxID=933992 RepID=UPI00351E9DD5